MIVVIKAKLRNMKIEINEERYNIVSLKNIKRKHLKHVIPC